MMSFSAVLASGPKMHMIDIRGLKALQAQLARLRRILSLFQRRIRSALVSEVRPLAEKAAIARHVQLRISFVHDEN